MLYGFLSMVYRGIVLVAILFYVRRLLSTYDLETLGNALIMLILLGFMMPPLVASDDELDLLASVVVDSIQAELAASPNKVLASG